jgi:hypothetical protein
MVPWSVSRIVGSQKTSRPSGRKYSAEKDIKSVRTSDNSYTTVGYTKSGRLNRISGEETGSTCARFDHPYVLLACSRSFCFQASWLRHVRHMVLMRVRDIQTETTIADDCIKQHT